MDWIDLLAVQGTRKSFLQHHSSKASALQCSSFFYGPALTSIHDYWKNYSFDYMDLCWRSNVSAFHMLSRFVIPFLARSKQSFNFIAAAIVHSDFRAQENKGSDQKAWSSLITVFLSGFIYFMWLVERSSWLNLQNRFRIWALLPTSTVTAVVASSLIGTTAASHAFSSCHSFILSLHSQRCSWSDPFKTSQIMSSLCRGIPQCLLDSLKIALQWTIRSFRT